jgi:hypothetical protein
MRFPLFLRLALAGLLLLSLAGCVEMKYHLTIHGNGSADLNYHLALDSSLANMGGEAGNPIADARKDLEKEGYKVTDYSGNGKTGIDATKHFQKLEDIKGLTKFFDKDQKKMADQSGAFTIKRGFFANQISVNSAIDLGNGEPAPTDEMSKAMEQSMMSQFQMSFVLTLPAKPKSHNATTVSKDGKTLEWKLAPDRKNEIKLEMVAPNMKNITLVVLGVVVLLGLVLVPVLRRKKA